MAIRELLYIGYAMTLVVWLAWADMRGHVFWRAVAKSVAQTGTVNHK